MDINFNKNEDYNKLLVAELKRRFAQVKLGGGEKRIAKLHGEGKMTARERIDYLLDTKAKNIEIGGFVGDGMYAEHGGCPSGGSAHGVTRRIWRLGAACAYTASRSRETPAPGTCSR